MEFKGTKEKAEELRDKYLNVRWDIGTGYAKQCAIIAVNEIIKYTFDENNVDTYILREYLWDVKQEIEKL